ncbi:MAG: nickel pincer cofactor biosynthesis protein LarB [Anaerolineae bacterium]
MTDQQLRDLLAGVRDGSIALDDALEGLRSLPFEDIGFAHIDHHRQIRCGFPEVVFAQGKTPEQTAEIMARLVARGSQAMATRANREHFAAVRERLPEAVYHDVARIILGAAIPEAQGDHYVAVVSAGTSDIPVAEEAAITAEFFGSRVERVYDVGVAGLHRLLAHRVLFDRAAVVIVVAGMEGALASVVGGLVTAPVVAVPTSVGYGAAFGGLAPLLTMLNSCASGVAVVNIDNGFGAAYFASAILRTISKSTCPEGQ